VIIKFLFDAVQPLDDFVKSSVHFFKAPVNIVPEIVETLVLRPLGNPDCSHKRNHDRQRDGQEKLKRRVHSLQILPPNRSQNTPQGVYSCTVSKLLLLFLPALLSAAILPDTIGDWKKGPASPAPVLDQKVWQEYGLQDSETAEYTSGATKYSISAWRFADATGAFSAFNEIRPPDAKAIEVSGLGASNAVDEVVAVGNYLFLFKGYKPKPEELNHVVGTVPRYSQSPLPSLPKYLPEGAELNSERYITGPESLARFAPEIPPSTAAFHFNAEAELAKFGKTTLLLFNYPTMEMARDRIAHFQQVPGAVVKRAGPLVAVALHPASADDAERLLARIKYQAEVTLPEHVPTLKDNPANLFLNIFVLCLVLAGFCVVSGLVVGGLRVLLRRAGASGEGDNMISLRLSGRP
jgi:hypothetical protein